MTPSVAGTSSIVLINKDYVHPKKHGYKTRSVEAGYYRCAHIARIMMILKGL